MIEDTIRIQGGVGCSCSAQSRQNSWKLTRDWENCMIIKTKHGRQIKLYGQIWLRGNYMNIPLIIKTNLGHQIKLYDQV